MATKKAENKTKATEISVDAFLQASTDGQQRDDSIALVKLMEKATGFSPKMWGASIVGFGSYHYKYKSGREGDMPSVSFSPRSKNITLYLGLSSEHCENLDELLAKLGKHTTGKGCLYINSLADVDTRVLETIIAKSAERFSEK
ncbi:MAG: DUF1801 domain-containing protein [Candidatus Kapaibacterium sp.]|nr:MAG: DUF1801 domain-containing protein [Candidatus Kapabacteria bacterium]